MEKLPTHFLQDVSSAVENTQRPMKFMSRRCLQK